MTSPGKEMIVMPPPPSKATPNSAMPSRNNVPSTSIIVNPNTPLPWSSGLCDCFNDCENCCLTYCCPCVTFGRIAEIVDRGTTPCGVSGTLYLLIMLATGCSCLYSCFYRSKMRGQFFLEESPCTDICVHCWCEPCALCQEYRELQHRGFDPSIGWYGNMESQRRTIGTMAPPMPGAGGMYRG